MASFKEKIHTINRELTSRILVPTFFHIGRLDAPRSFETGDHLHFCYEYIYILKGRSRFWINEKEFEAPKGSCYFLMPGQHHRERTLKAPFSFYHLKFYLRDLRGEHVLLLPLDNDPGRQVFERPGRVCLSLFREILDEARSDKPWRRETVDSLCLRMTAWCKRKLGLKPDPMDRFAGKAELIVNKTKEFVAFKMAQDIDLPAIARHCGISTDYLGHMFKQSTGISPMQYLSRVRIEEAKRLLLNPGLHLEEIARKTGFRDIFYFSRKFKMAEKISPGLYRKRTLFDK